MNPSLDLFAYADTRAMAREGMQRAVDHADRIEPSWSESATEILRRYAQFTPEFMGEDVRAYAHKIEHLPLPPDPRAWGAVVNSAVRSGIIARDRYELTKIPPAHATPRPVWRSLIYRRAA